MTTVWIFKDGKFRRYELDGPLLGHPKLPTTFMDDWHDGNVAVVGKAAASVLPRARQLGYGDECVEEWKKERFEEWILS